MHIQLHYDPSTLSTSSSGSNEAVDIRLQISRADERGVRKTAAIIDVPVLDPRSNVTQILVPCQRLLLGGAYDFEIVANHDDAGGDVDAANNDERLRRQLDIRWPVPRLSVTPESVGTYPEGPVDVIIEFPGVECALPAGERAADVPEFWLELFYCGHDVYCDNANVSAVQKLFAEQVRGYPHAVRVVQLSCELFGLAGHYVVKLRPTGAVVASVSATAYVKVSAS